MPRLDPSKIKLQPLGIPAGWFVLINHFYQVEPRLIPPRSRVWLHFSQDMLLLSCPHCGVRIDLGWYERKEYRANAVEMFDKRSRSKSIQAWDNPLRSFRTRSTARAAATINEWIDYYETHPIKSLPAPSTARIW